MNGQGPSLPRSVRLTLIFALFAYVVSDAWLAWRTSILEPYSDMFDWIERWNLYEAHGDLARYLWSPHNFHHLIWTFTVLGLDIRAFGASGYLFLAVGVICLAATAAMLAVLAACAAGPGLRLVGASAAIAFSVMGCDVLDATADINTTYFHAVAFAVAAIFLAGGARPPAGSGRLAALACAVAAGLGSAAGLAVWPALFFSAWRGGERRWALAVLAAGGAFSAVYLLGQNVGPDPSSGPIGLGRLADSAALFVDYLGLPWMRGAPSAGWLIGLTILALSTAAVVFKGRRGASGPERAAVSLIVFSLVTAAMAGAVRTSATTPELVPMRYAVFLIPLHVGLCILALPYLRRAWETRPRMMQGAVVAAAAFLLVHQTVMGVYAVRTADTNLQLIAAFRAGERRPAMSTTIYADLGRAQSLATQMRRDGFYQRELRPDPPPLP